MLLLPQLRMGAVRLAAQGALPVLDQRLRGTRFLAHSARSVLNPPESTGIGCWSLNPYIGCEFGCSYCYARFAHRYVVERARDAGRLTPAELGRLRGPRGWEGFEHQIFVKRRPAVLAALERDLARVLARYRRGRREPVLIGTATDPYQPAERRFGITRAVLERLTQAPPLNVGLITKSPLVTRDVELLARLATRHHLTVHLSLISTRRGLIRMFEPRSPMPHARLRAVRKLVAAGVHAGLLVAPILPGITDRSAHLRLLLRAAREHGARCAHPSPLRLYAAVRPVLLPVLERQFPALVPRYLAAYRRAEDAPREYARGLKDRFARLAAEIGINTEDDRFGDDEERATGARQLALWNDTPAEEP
jgi:DNA repair photolyase